MRASSANSEFTSHEDWQSLLMILSPATLCTPSGDTESKIQQILL